MANDLYKLSLLVLTAMFSFSCSKTPDKTAVAKAPTHTLIFIDKTQSIDLSKPFLAQKYQQELNNIITQNIDSEGDKLEVYYIHENTARARCMSMMCRSSMGDVTGKNATDLEAMKMAFDLSINKEKNIFLRNANQKLMQANGTASNNFTDVLASIEVIAKAAENSTDLRVYFFSDMIESMKGADRRDFQLLPPKSAEQAVTWAKKDAERYKDLVLGSPEITMISPFEATASSAENNPNVAVYWRTVFETLGVSMINEI